MTQLGSWLGGRIGPCGGRPLDGGVCASLGVGERRSFKEIVPPVCRLGFPMIPVASPAAAPQKHQERAFSPVRITPAPETPPPTMRLPPWLVWYKKPEYRDIKEYAAAIGTGKRAVSPDGRGKSAIPSRLSLERVLENKTCTGVPGRMVAAGGQWTYTEFRQPHVAA